MTSPRLRSLLLPLLLALAPGAARPQGAQTRVDYLVLVDVSGSMSGLPAGSGHVDIFPKVQDALAHFITELPPGNRVSITPFAESLGPTRRFEVVDAASTAAAVAYVRSLQATGSQTHVYRSMREVFGRYTDERGNGGDRIAVLMVFTDGLDNGPERMTMHDVVREFGLRRRENDFVYYATLGVSLPPSEAAALAQSGFGAHDPSPAGDVHPVRVVQPRYGLLVFGNLKRDPAARRVLALDVQGAPGDLRLGTRTSFPSLAENGAYAEVTPRELPVLPEVQVGLRLVNPQGIAMGDYEGTIQLEPPDPRVIVVPRQIRARFTYALPRTARVLAAPGGRRPTLELGKVDPFRASGGRTAAASLRLQLDAEAAARGGDVGVRVLQDAANATVLPPEALRVNGRPGDVQQLAVGGRTLELAVAVRRDQVRPGRTYRGTLELSDGSVEVAGPRRIPWRFEVARAPLSALAIAVRAALALAALAGMALFARYWASGGILPPVLRGRLTVREPQEAWGREIPLAGRRQVTLGSGSSELPDAGGRVRIVPERSRRRFRVKLLAEDGTVTIRRPGEAWDVPVAADTLQDADVIALPPYRLEYSRS